jgi:hypothetical protein
MRKENYMNVKRMVSIFVVLFAVGTVAWAQTYRVTFYSSGTTIWDYDNDEWGSGHAFVYIENYGTVGFYPATVSPWGGRGVIRDDSNHYYNNEVSFRISSEAWNDAVVVARNWRNNPPNYNLGGNDCINFVMAIADAIGLDYNFSTTPTAIVNDLRDMN